MSIRVCKVLPVTHVSWAVAGALTFDLWSLMLSVAVSVSVCCVVSRSVCVCRCWNTATLLAVVVRLTFVVRLPRHAGCCVLSLSLSVLILRLQHDQPCNPSWRTQPCNRLLMPSCFLGWVSNMTWRHLYTDSAPHSLTSRRPRCHRSVYVTHTAVCPLHWHFLCVHI